MTNPLVEPTLCMRKPKIRLLLDASAARKPKIRLRGLPIIYPRRACAESVTVVLLCVCMSVTHTLFWQYARLKV